MGYHGKYVRDVMLQEEGRMWQVIQHEIYFMTQIYREIIVVAVQVEAVGGTRSVVVVGGGGAGGGGGGGSEKSLKELALKL
jgi:hypothetical protein